MTTAATKGRPISEQLRDAIREADLSVGAIAREADLDDGCIHRFMSGQRGLTTASFDRIAEVLGLKLVEARPGGRSRRTGRRG